MITINALNHLRQFGIDPLTGEADALNFRVLCDLTENGRKIVAQALGINENGFPANWNSRGVASCMLSDDLTRTLGIVAGALAGKTVVVTEKSVFIIEDGEEIIDSVWESIYDEKHEWTGSRQVEPHKYHETKFPIEDARPWPEDCYGKIQRIFRTLTKESNSGQPRIGLRNTHAMSGRTQ